MSDDASVSLPVEVIPSRQGEISAIASAHAPFLYFDNAPNFGYNHGIINITLEAVRFMASAGGQPTMDRVIVAHLRMSIPAAMSLKSALDGAMLLATPAAGQDLGQVPKPN
jgi:hypothetical protein